MSEFPVSSTATSAETSRAQIAHVLFLDIVGYSRGSITDQKRLLERLNAIVEQSPTFARARADARKRGKAGRFHPIATGDGMALLFFDDVTAPACCAIEIGRLLHKQQTQREASLEDAPPLSVRMGIHSGLVQPQMDITGSDNVVGEGINTAQRVMSFGDAGHILLSSQYAGWLTQFEEWTPRVAPLGDAVAKHGLPLSLFSLHGRDYGCAEAPSALSQGDSPAGTGGPKIILLYRRYLDPDEAVLQFVEQSLRAEGFDVFIDRHTRIGIEWAREVEQKIRAADAVVAIVSPKALRSEMLEFELETAADQNGKTGKPLILPVRIGLDDALEGPVASIIAPLTEFRWNGHDDAHRLAAELISAIREPLRQRAAELHLEPVGGAVRPDSPFYVERQCDGELTQALKAQESIILLKGPRQVGKTSLQARCAQRVRQNNWRLGLTDFQKVGQAQMTHDDTFYRLLAATLARQLGFAYDFALEWDDLFGASLNLEAFLRALLEASDQPLVWCMDEVDKLFTAPFASDFFGLVRSWHNSRSTEPNGPWGKLTVVIAYATEAHLFIQDLNQSPFNVGRRIDLDDFNLQQTIDLNHRYGDPLSRYADAEAVFALIGGQPYLTRRALDLLATGKTEFVGLMDNADHDDGPFSEHLKRIFASISSLPAITEFLRAMIAGTATAIGDRESYYRLLAAGIIQQNPDGRLAFRCELYRRYLSRHLT